MCTSTTSTCKCQESNHRLLWSLQALAPVRWPWQHHSSHRTRLSYYSSTHMLPAMPGKQPSTLVPTCSRTSTMTLATSHSSWYAIFVFQEAHATCHARRGACVMFLRDLRILSLLARGALCTSPPKKKNDENKKYRTSTRPALRKTLQRLRIDISVKNVKKQMELQIKCK